MVFKGVATSGAARHCLVGSPGVRVASFDGGGFSAVDLLNNPPGVVCVGAEGLMNKLLEDALVGVSSCSPVTPTPGVGCGGVPPGLGAVDSPSLLNGEGPVPGDDSTPKRGFLAGSETALAGSIPRENGCIFERSGLLFCKFGVSH